MPNKTLNDVLPEILARGDAQNPDIPPVNAGSEQPAEQPIEQQPAQPDTTAEQQPTSPAVPETPTQPEAAQPAQTTNLDAILRATEAYQQAQAENAQLKERLKTLEAASEQQSQAAEQQIANAALQLPKLNRDGYEYLSDEERDKRETEYSFAMAEYMKSQIMGEIKPAMDYYNKQSKAADYETARSVITSSPEFAGIIDDMDGINRIISNTPELQSIDPQKQMILAGLINKGINTINTKTSSPKPEDLATQAMNNPEVMKIIETKRAQDIATKNQGMPPMSVNSGMSSVSAMPQEKPKSWADALANAIKRGGG